MFNKLKLASNILKLFQELIHCSPGFLIREEGKGQWRMDKFTFYVQHSLSGREKTQGIFKNLKGGKINSFVSHRFVSLEGLNAWANNCYILIFVKNC